MLHVSSRPTPGQIEQMRRCQQLLGQRRLVEAVQSARTLAAALPGNVDALQLLAICEAENGRVEVALDVFARAHRSAPEVLAVAMNHAALLQRAGRRDQAMSLLDGAVRQHPTQVLPLRQLGLLALESGRLVEAERALLASLGLAPDDALAWQALGTVRRRLGRLEEARADFEHSCALRSDDPVTWVNLGAVARLLGDIESARVSYERALSLGYEQPHLLDAINGVSADEGQPQEAIEGARRLVFRHPGYAPGHDTLARLLWEYGDVASGRALPFDEFRAAVRAQPRNRPMWQRYIRLLLEAGQVGEALALAGDLVRRSPGDPVAAWLLADALDLAGEGVEAARLFQQVDLAMAGRSGAFLNAHMRHLFRRGDVEQARHQAERALVLDDCDQKAWSHLGTAWRLQGDPREHWLFDYERLVGVVEVEPPSGYADIESYLRALKAVLDELHQAQREPVNQSVRGGSQTTGRLFGRTMPEIEQARQSLLAAAARWVAALPEDSGHPFLARRGRWLRPVGSWSVKLWNSGHHTNHIHNEGWMSSAFYVSLPSSVTRAAAGSAGCLQFGQPLASLGLDLPPRRIVRPQVGQLALFPSYLWHGTLPFNDEHARMTIAFDMQPVLVDTAAQSAITPAS